MILFAYSFLSAVRQPKRNLQHISTNRLLCTALEKVEQIYKASLIPPKEVQKEPTTKKPLPKAARKEQRPLFDINPRTAQEFLVRAQSTTDKLGVIFQSSEEKFTQWKEEEKQAAQAEQSPIGPPTSFAQALLRKLNINDGSNDPKGSTP